MRLVTRPPGVTLAALVVAMGVIALAPPQGRLQGVAILLLAGLLSFVIALNGHELGHVIGAMLVRFQVSLFIAGPFHLERRTEGGYRIKWNQHWGFYGGLVAAFPVDMRQERSPQVVFTAGGPLASILIAVAAFAVMSAVGLGGISRSRFESGSITGWELGLSAFLLLLGAESAAIALVTLFPGKTSGFMTDGARLLSLLRESPEADPLVAARSISSMLLAGIRPRDLDAVLIERSLRAASEGDTASAHYFAYTWALDAGDIERAAQHLDRMLDGYAKVSTALQPTLALEAAYFEARYRHNLAAAQEWLGKVKESPFVYTASIRRAQAAVEFEKGNAEDAARLVREGVALVDQVFGAGSIAAEWEKLEALIKTEKH